MPEILEGPEEHGAEPWTLPVAVTLAILAVLVAMATLMGHRAATEELLLQNAGKRSMGVFSGEEYPAARAAEHGGPAGDGGHRG